MDDMKEDLYLKAARLCTEAGKLERKGRNGRNGRNGRDADALRRRAAKALSEANKAARAESTVKAVSQAVQAFQELHIEIVGNGDEDFCDTRPESMAERLEQIIEELSAWKGDSTHTARGCINSAIAYLEIAKINAENSGRSWVSMLEAVEKGAPLVIAERAEKAKELQ